MSFASTKEPKSEKSKLSSQHSMSQAEKDDHSMHSHRSVATSSVRRSERSAASNASRLKRDSKSSRNSDRESSYSNSMSQLDEKVSLIKMRNSSHNGEDSSDRSDSSNESTDQSYGSGFKLDQNSMKSSNMTTLDRMKKMDQTISKNMANDPYGSMAGATGSRTAYKTNFENPTISTRSRYTSTNTATMGGTKSNEHTIRAKTVELCGKCELSKYIKIGNDDSITGLKHKFIRKIKEDGNSTYAWNLGVQKGDGTWFSDKTLVKDTGISPTKFYVKNKLTFFDTKKNKHSKEMALYDRIRKKQSYEDLKDALDRIPSVNISDNNDPLLHFAIKNDAPTQFIENIVERFFNLETRDSEGNTPHLVALKCKKFDLFKYFCEKCEEMIDSCNGNRVYPTEMTIIVLPDSIAYECLKYLESKGVNIAKSRSNFRKSIDLSCLLNKDKVTYILCRNGASLSKHEFINCAQLCKQCNNTNSLVNIAISFCRDNDNDKELVVPMLRYICAKILADKPHMVKELKRYIPFDKDDMFDGDKIEIVLPPEEDIYFLLDENAAQIRQNKLQAGRKFDERITSELINAKKMAGNDFTKLVSGESSRRSRSSAMSSMSNMSSENDDLSTEMVSTMSETNSTNNSEANSSSSSKNNQEKEVECDQSHEKHDNKDGEVKEVDGDPKSESNKEISSQNDESHEEEQKKNNIDENHDNEDEKDESENKEDNDDDDKDDN